MLGRKRTGGRSTTWLASICGGIAVAGYVVIALYGLAAPGNRAQVISTGLLTALAAYLTGFLLGFLFGIPRYVSSGEFRLAQKPALKQGTSPPDGAAALPSPSPSSGESQPAAPADVPPERRTWAFTPSTNLAEVSDWLTKLLLGAGLVQLTHLGPPLASLINSVAAGLEGGAAVEPSGSATVMAGAILITYTVLGFLVGYVLTTLWYGNRLAESGRAEG